jgi:putative membrane-bound dehydrogenase-like protein
MICHSERSEESSRSVDARKRIGHPTGFFAALRMTSGGWRTVAVALVLLGALHPTARAYKEVPPPDKVVLPPAKSAADSLAAIAVPDDLQVELVAAEPLTMDPINLAWDAKGRMWVVEMADYPLGIDGKGTPGGRIRFLESTRGDGRYDKSTLFAEGLSYPSGIAPWRNGVVVVAMPNILFLEDTDGDGRADRTTTLYTGIAEGNQQHLANGLQWGLDGWLYLGNGNSGGKVKSVKTDEVVDIGTRDFRIQPDTGGLEVLAGHSQYGLNRDDWGNWFGCNNSNPAWHFVLEDRYLRRNPHLVPPNSTVAVSVTPGAAPVFPRSETLARFNDPQGHNHFTSACSVMIYRDDLLGREYAGNLFVCEPVHNLMHREIVKPVGVTFSTQRAPREQASEVLASTDNWSRFCAVRAGPDGALYVVDMYRMVIEHPKWIPDAWQKQLGDLRQGSDKGRIYRLRPKNTALRTMPKLDGVDTPEQLLKALESPSGTVRDLAQQQLVWRGDKTVAPLLERIVKDSPRPATRVQALTTLALLDALAPQVVGWATTDSHPGVRKWALRLSERFEDRVPPLSEQVVALANDPDPSVRLQAACTLGEWKKSRAAGVALARLVRADEDPMIRAAAMSSALPHADTILAQLSGGGASDEAVMVEIATVTQNAKALASLLAAIVSSGAEDAVKQFNGLARLLDWLQRNNKTLTQLQSSPEAAMKDALGAADRIFEKARTVVADGRASLQQRVAAVHVLARGRTKQNDDFDALVKLLTPQSPTELQLAAITALGRINRNNVPERLLAGWAGYSPKVRTAVLDLAISRPAWAQTLLDRVEKDPGLRAQIDASRKLALKQHGNARVAERATAIFSAGLDANRQKVIDRYLAAQPALKANPAKGAETFAAVCSACHKFGDVPGKAIGPDLASVKDRTPEYLIPHILDPNRAVEDRYMLYTATTQDGRTFAGTLAGEAGNSVTIVGLDGVEQPLLRADLRSLVSTGRSLMPDGLEAAINEQGMADLVAFLAGGNGSGH